MAKTKSTKLRIFITLQTLIKYADKDHGLNSITLNDYLRPHGLECRNKYFRSTIKALRDFGVDVQRKNGVWIKNRPLTDERLQIIAFALASNPYIAKEQAEDALQSLKPFVTIYQEKLLNNYIERTATSIDDDLLYHNSCIIQKAMLINGQIKFSNVEAKEASGNKFITFTPKSIYQDNGCFYIVGYNHSKKANEELNIKTITNIKLIAPKKAGSNG